MLPVCGAKADRHINEISRARNTAAAAHLYSHQAGSEGYTDQTQAQSSASATASIDSQISDARDVHRADAMAQRKKPRLSWMPLQFWAQ